jgi:hypothetical protein
MTAMAAPVILVVGSLHHDIMVEACPGGMKPQ